MTIQRQLSYKIHEFVERNHFKGGKRIAFIISKLLLPSKKTLTIITTREGMKMHVNAEKDKGIDSVLYYTGTYEAGLVEVMKGFLQEGNTFLEVGANIGPFSIAADAIMNDNGHIYAIEPDPEIKGIIERSIKENNVKSIKTINLGVSDKDSTLRLYLKPYVNRGASSLIAEDGDKSIDIKVTTLDKIMDQYKINHVDMVVIDVEGWEMHVLQGASKLLKSKNLPLLSVEINSKYSPEDIYNKLAGVKEYTIYKLVNGKEFISKLTKVHSFKDVRMDDNIFCLTKDHEARLAHMIL